MKAVFVDAGTFGKDEQYETLKKIEGVEWQFIEKCTPEEMNGHLEGATIALTNKAKFNRDLLLSLPDLKLICITATGVDCVDLEAAKQAGITVCNVTGYSKGTVTQLTILMMLCLANSFYPYAEDVKKGRWQKGPYFCFLDYPITEVRGKTLGIFGYGNLGQEVGRIASAFGMQVVPVERKGGKNPIPGALPLAQVLKTCDFFTIHSPLTKETENLIGQAELSLMKKTAYLINVSRGGIVNELALANALKNRTIAGAALDVLTSEPPKPDNPLLDPTIPNLLLTPHIGWASKEARAIILDVTRDSILGYLKGYIANQVTV
jgi:glycerate dehydrogenase